MKRIHVYNDESATLSYLVLIKKVKHYFILPENFEKF